MSDDQDDYLQDQQSYEEYYEQRYSGERGKERAAIEKRRGSFAAWMEMQGIAAVVFEDTELRRNPAVRYFSGHPTDALLVMSDTSECVLIPWDENLAAERADAENIIPYTRFGMNPVKAAEFALKVLETPPRTRIEIPEATPYPLFLEYVDGLKDFDVVCRKDGSEAEVAQMRAKKDAEEIALTRKACSIADSIAKSIEKKLVAGQLKTEADVAFFIEKEARKAGAEGTSFATIAAGPSRSCMIHAFPSFGSGEFGAEGLSILDFGVLYKGYASDITLTFAAGNLSEKQKALIAAVEEAYAEALKLYKPGVVIREAAIKADEIFSKINEQMPHGLGHGIGLAIHEAPFVRSRLSGGANAAFESGMIVTLEPGLYSKEAGGVRLENDVLITQDGNEVLTHSRIVYL